jgi:hypothetical protein
VPSARVVHFASNTMHEPQELDLAQLQQVTGGENALSRIWDRTASAASEGFRTGAKAPGQSKIVAAPVLGGLGGLVGATAQTADETGATRAATRVARGVIDWFRR